MVGRHRHCQVVEIEESFLLFLIPLGIVLCSRAPNYLFVDSRHVTGNVQTEDKHDLHQLYLTLYYRKPLLQESW